MTYMHYLGSALVLLFIIILGWYSGKEVKTGGDFISGGKKAGVGVVTGTIIGTLVGGSATIGTAQLAFTYGFSAWWFTLGGGLGCLFLGLFFTKPLYNSNITTLPQVFQKEYGRTASTLSAILMSIGSLLSIMAQLLSGIALITSITHFNASFATVLVILLMLIYIIFGGLLGAGIVGIAKTILLSISILICGSLALYLAGGLSNFLIILPREQYFNLIARGVGVDIGAGISMILGILSTQTYIQAIISARNFKVSYTGALIGAIIIPLIGIFGILVGMYMKIYFPEISPSFALPLFILNHIHPIIGGMILSTLLISLVGTGSGLALGVSSMICNDVYKVYFNKNANSSKMLQMSRVFIAVILVIAGLLTFGNIGSLILSWSFMSMGLRGAVAFAPLCCALFFPGRINKKYATLSMIFGPVFVLIGRFTLPEEIDSLFSGIIIAILILFLGYISGNKGDKELKT